MDGRHANIEYDEETDQFRGEIFGLSAGSGFYGFSPDELRRVFKKSLDVFLWGLLGARNRAPQTLFWQV